MHERRLAFGVFELNLATGELRRAGYRMPLPPQPGKLLAALLQRPGAVVTREELRVALWGEGTFVDFDHGLNFCVNQLRRILGDRASSPRFIETVPRVGYRFLAPVTAASVPEAPRARGLRGARWLTPVLAAWVVSQGGSGPLAARTPVTEPRASVREVYLRGIDHARRGPSEWPQAAQWLERAVVEDPSYAPAQAALAGIYVRLAQARLRPGPDVLPLARAAARAALDADDRSAEAHLWAGMAALHGDWDWAVAGREIRHAIALDPRLAEARREHAVYLTARGDDTGALREIQEARRLDPLCPIVTGEAAWYCYRAGRTDEAAALWRAAATLRTDLGLHEALLLLYREQGRPESAAEEALRAMRAAGVPERHVAEVSLLPPPEAAQAYLRGAIRWLNGHGRRRPSGWPSCTRRWVSPRPPSRSWTAPARSARSACPARCGTRCSTASGRTPASARSPAASASPPEATHLLRQLTAAPPLPPNQRCVARPRPARHWTFGGARGDAEPAFGVIGPAVPRPVAPRSGVASGGGGLMRLRAGTLVLMTVLAGGCGGGGTPPPGGATPVIQVGGTYPTAVALVENDCGSVTVQPNITTVGHTPGATRLTLTHAATTYNGSLLPDGSFTTDPMDLRDTDGSTLTVRITGRFNTTGFDAAVTVDVLRTAGTRCRYVVRWTGTKQGAPNVLP